MNISITGAVGHIGSKLIRSLSIPGLKRVYLVDNLLTQRYVSLFDLPDGIDFVFHEIDIRSEKMKPIVEKCDVLVHLAAVTDAAASFERAGEVEEINRQGFEYVADLCAGTGCALLFPSSTSVYGTQSSRVDETCTADELKPQSPYADSKIFGENLMARLSRTRGLRYAALRIGTIFGFSVGMRFHTAVNKFIWQASTGVPITVWKTALHQKRPYCDLNDCIAAINLFVLTDCFKNEIYNIVTGNFTVNDVIEAIRKHVPDIRVSFVDSPIMNQLSYEVSNEKSLALGLRYHGSLEKGIREILCSLKNVRADILVKGLDS